VCLSFIHYWSNITLPLYEAATELKNFLKHGSSYKGFAYDKISSFSFKYFVYEKYVMKYEGK
jgi:hypothetical protein